MRAPSRCSSRCSAVLLAAPALAASGVALGVDQNATLEGEAGARILAVGSDVFIGDKVVTDASGLVELRFSDSTRLVIGPRSSLVIEDYLLREDGSAGKFAVNALAGTFRFITGGAPKDRYLITTPTGTVGVRGTAFDLNVEAAATSLLLFHGAVILCTLDGKCVIVDEVCELGQAKYRGGAGSGPHRRHQGPGARGAAHDVPLRQLAGRTARRVPARAGAALPQPAGDVLPEQDPVSNVGEPEKYRGPAHPQPVP
jgi:ferric-dicitrate binding protein FerR (iron transport regulator)